MNPEMNHALEEKAAQALSEILDLALQTKDFAVEQAPDVIKQLLAWNFTISLLQTVFTALLVVGSAAFAIYMLRKAPIRWDDTEKFPSHAIGVIVLVLDLFILFSAFARCEWIWLEILVAPKLFLIEYATRLVL